MAEDDVEVARWYTRARRFPQLVGKFHDGRPIPGGPYTYTQVVVLVATVWIGVKTSWLWGHFGTIFNWLILFAVAYGGAILVGRLPIGARNPLVLVGWAGRAVSRPSAGTIAGRPARLSKPHRAAGRCVITTTEQSQATPVAVNEEATPTRPPVPPRPTQGGRVAISSAQRLLSRQEV